MAKIIEAKAIISAEDKTGGVFDKIAKKIEGIAKSAGSSVEVDRLSKALASAQKQMAAIDRFGAARGGFAEARLRFREAELAVTKAAQAMKRGEGDARQLARSYALAQKSVVSASAAFERQQRVGRVVGEAVTRLFRGYQTAHYAFGSNAPYELTATDF